jgi:hypothetical protein
MDADEPEKVDELDTYVLVERFQIGKVSQNQSMLAG